MKSYALIISLCILTTISCENRDLNEGEKFRPRELHDNFQDSHFTLVTVDGVELHIDEDASNTEPISPLPKQYKFWMIDEHCNQFLAGSDLSNLQDQVFCSCPQMHCGILLHSQINF